MCSLSYLGLKTLHLTKILSKGLVRIFEIFDLLEEIIHSLLLV